MRRLSVIILFISLTFFNEEVFSGGSDLTQLAGSKRLALNGLYIAGIDGVSNITINPAGLTSLRGYGIEISASNRLGEQFFSQKNGDYFQSFREDDYSINGGFYLNLAENLTVGAGYYPYMRFKVSWPFAALREKGSTSESLSFDMLNDLTIETIAPGISYKFGNASIGASLNIYETKMKTAFPQDNAFWSADSGLAAYQYAYSLSGWGYGFTIGVNYSLNENIDLAASVISGFSAELTGDANSFYFSDIHSAPTISEISADFESPWILNFGGVFNLSEGLVLNIDARYNLWSNVTNNYLFNFAQSGWSNNITGVDSAFAINPKDFSIEYQNSLDAGLGFEYASSHSIRYRLSYRFSQSAFTDESKNMLFPTVDQHWLAAGVGISEDVWTIDVSVAYAFSFEKTVDAPLDAASGKYDQQMFLPSLNLRYNF